MRHRWLRDVRPYGPGRANEWDLVPSLCPAGAGPDLEAWRQCDHEQPRRPQERSRPECHRSRRRPAAIPAALQPRPQPDLERFYKIVGLPENGCGLIHRTALGRHRQHHPDLFTSQVRQLLRRRRVRGRLIGECTSRVPVWSWAPQRSQACPGPSGSRREPPCPVRLRGWIRRSRPAGPRSARSGPRRRRPGRR